MSRERQMHLNVFLHGVGQHEAAWRLPESDPRATFQLDHYVRLARIAERGTFDSIFFADVPHVHGNVRHRPVGALDPVPLIAAIGASTDRIGLIATASTTFADPFAIARQFATIDHISQGRAGWNVVTSWTADAARNFSLDDMPGHEDRYRRADEHVGVVARLWDSWEDDAIVADRESGIYADDARIHAIDHVGEHFSVQGPSTVARSPQGRPVLVQAGSSEQGRDLAARWADVVFTVQQGLAGAQAFYADVKARAKDHGRDPETVLILPGFAPIIGGTHAEAVALEERLGELMVDDYSVDRLSMVLGVDLQGVDLDGPLPDLPPPAAGTMRSRVELIQAMARDEGLTVRQIMRRTASARGHHTVIGAPEQIADELEAWFRGGGGDGFNLMPAVMPSQLEAFVDHVVPELRRRGLFRSEYEGTTLREHLGLARPRSRSVTPATS